jgi:hypothetical protein
MAEKRKTKFCKLDIYLKSGISVSGQWHVPAHLDASIRPSDALGAHPSPFLILSAVTIHDREDTHQRECVIVRIDAIGFIELPAENWNRVAEPEPTLPDSRMRHRLD